MKKFFICKLAMIALLCSLESPAFAAETITVKDISGRDVTLEVPVKTMVLGEGRFLPTIGILDRQDPARRVVGMMGEFKKLDPTTYAQYAQKFPQIEEIPLIGSSGAATFNVETSLAIRPDVAIFGLGSGHGPNNKSKTILDQFADAGIPVVIIDFRIDPLVNTPKSMTLLGKVLGREKEAAEFIEFYQGELDRVATKVDAIKDRPTVFMESRVGLMPQCCEAMGQAMMGRFIDWAGGINAYGDKIPGTHGSIDREYLLVNQPDVYIGTAIGNSANTDKFPKFLTLGVGTTKTAAIQSLQNSLKRQELSSLSAVQDRKAHAIWHHFYNTPMNVAAVQIMAKWLHPDLFKDLDPHQTLETYFDRFQPVPLDGIYWISVTE